LILLVLVVAGVLDVEEMAALEALLVLAQVEEPQVILVMGAQAEEINFLVFLMVLLALAVAEAEVRAVIRLDVTQTVEAVLGAVVLVS
jgi:hypothetical protein